MLCDPAYYDKGLKHLQQGVLPIKATLTVTINHHFKNNAL